MGEPLKDERVVKMTTAEYVGRLVTEIPFELREGMGKILRLRKEEDIISAVELLKENITEKYKRDNPKIVVELIELIDEAFKGLQK